MNFQNFQKKRLPKIAKNCYGPPPTNNCSVRYRKVRIEKSGEEFNNIEIRVSDTVLYLYFLLTLGMTNLVYHKFSQTFD